MHLEADLGRDASALDQLAPPPAAASDCERCTLFDEVNVDLGRVLKSPNSRHHIPKPSQTSIIAQLRPFTHPPPIPTGLPRVSHLMRRIFCSDEGAGALAAYARDHPPSGPPGGRVGVPQTPCLLAPADDRNALATTAGGLFWPCAYCTLAATPARSISLARWRQTGRALQCPQRSQFIPEQSENYTVSPSAAN